MLELDQILIPFFDQHFEALRPKTQETFIQLLEEPDQTLQGWLVGQSLPEDPKFSDLVLVIRHFAGAPLPVTW